MPARKSAPKDEELQEETPEEPQEPEEEPQELEEEPAVAEPELVVAGSVTCSNCDQPATWGSTQGSVSKAYFCDRHAQKYQGSGIAPLKK